jgi:hypothetical protein
MARFFGSIQGSKGEATRLGTAKTGIQGHIRGWDIGAKVMMDVTSDDKDVVEVYITRGSNGRGPSLFLGRFEIKDGEIVKQ